MRPETIRSSALGAFLDPEEGVDCSSLYGETVGHVPRQTAWVRARGRSGVTDTPRRECLDVAKGGPRAVGGGIDVVHGEIGWAVCHERGVREPGYRGFDGRDTDREADRSAPRSSGSSIASCRDRQDSELSAPPFLARMFTESLAHRDQSRSPRMPSSSSARRWSFARTRAAEVSENRLWAVCHNVPKTDRNCRQVHPEVATKSSRSS